MTNQRSVEPGCQILKLLISDKWNEKHVEGDPQSQENSNGHHLTQGNEPRSHAHNCREEKGTAKRTKPGEGGRGAASRASSFQRTAREMNRDPDRDENRAIWRSPRPERGKQNQNPAGLHLHPRFLGRHQGERTLADAAAPSPTHRARARTSYHISSAKRLGQESPQRRVS